MRGERYATSASLRGWRVDCASFARVGDGRDDALHLDLDAGSAEIALSADGCVRLRAGATLPPLPEHAVERGPFQPVSGRAREHGKGVAWMSPSAPVHVEVEAEPLRITLRDRRGEEIACLLDLALEPDGAAAVALRVAPEERFYGFGEKPGPLDKRGAALLMRNRDPGCAVREDPLYASIPFFLVQRAGGAGAAGVLLDAFGPSRFDVARSHGERLRMETEADGIDLIVFAGPTPREVLTRFTARVGRAPLPPRWALGHHQSRWSYGSEREVRRLAGQIRRRGIPTDAIHLDIDHMDGYRAFTWHPKRFPDPPRLLADLAAQGFRIVTIVNPGVKVDPAYDVYREGLARDAFCRRDDGAPFSLRVWPGAAALPDFNRDDVRHWWGERHAPLLEAGVAGIWNDMNEPAGWNSDVRLGPFLWKLRSQDLSRMHQTHPVGPGAPGRRVPHERVRNLYGHQHARATREGLLRRGAGRRPFVLTRSGFAGVQRHAAVWTGDNASCWEHLRESLPMLLNLSLSGVPLCGADIGGFARACSPELYARWIQLGALYPFARTHSMGRRRQEPWRFGRRVEAIAREALRLRMRLLPYLYALCREAAETGAPLWRPLFFEFPDVPDCADVEDQVMLGDALLLAPVLERGARERRVRLPPGTWYAFHDDACYRGPREIQVAAPLDRLPLFVRGGSILPNRSPTPHVDAPCEEPLAFDLYPGGDALRDFVEDDGETRAHEHGETARTALRLWSRAGGRLRFELGRREGPFRVPERRLRVTLHGAAPPSRVLLDGVRLAEGAVPGYRFADGQVHIALVDRGEGAALEVEPAP